MSEDHTPTCSFVGSDGARCPGAVEGDGDLCFWHDPDASKEGDEVKSRLEEWARSGRSMEGFVLRFAHLEGVRLNDDKGLTLTNANLFHAHLEGAHLFNIDLRGADLLKANLSGASMNDAKLQNADLLGAIFDGTKLERVQWGDTVIQEQRARATERSGEREEALKLYLEAEEVYRNLRRMYDAAGRFEQAGHFFSKEMTMRRMMMSKWSGGRIFSKFVDLFCAYGESPPRVIGASIGLVLVCATFFFIVGVNGPDGPLGFDPNASLYLNSKSYLNCVYYSIVTFTTLGYGDITPRGFARPVAAIEAFMGAFMMALFIAVFGKKMTR